MPSKDSGLHAHYDCLETTIDALPALSKNPQKGELTDCKLIVQAQPTRGAAVGLCYILYHLRPSHQGGIERDCRCAARSHGYLISKADCELRMEMYNILMLLKRIKLHGTIMVFWTAWIAWMQE
ncbi:hypothetical protein T4D_6111 [Trichinella pseudospiralis]|uniref:Uncharacterized protein n=1 Tax=Trichinella pseudospiralis TaxID=6337 RepID=A0A0V1G1G5_TRIPS|nr:hypothetical protein T4D_6111 [Trichinella pseudospiralis]